MKTITTPFGLDEVTIYAPAVGELDLAAFTKAFPAGQLYGLDVETTWMSPVAQFAADFEIRKLQVATTRYAWVLDLDDPDQEAAARALLTSSGTRFTSHSGMDALAVLTRLGVDITDRYVDTLVLAYMAFGDDKAGRDLKNLAERFGMPQLAQWDAALMRLFRELWVAAGGRANSKASEIEAYGWSAVSGQDDTYLTYAGLDAIAVRRLVQPVAAATRAPVALLEREMWLGGQGIRVTARGMRVDLETLHRVASHAQGEAEAVRGAFLELTGLVPGSQHLLPHLETVTEVYMNKRGRESTRPVRGDDGKPVKRWAPGWWARHGVDWERWGPRTPAGAPSLEGDNLKLLADHPLDAAGERALELLLRYHAIHDHLNKTKGILAGVDPYGRVHPTLRTIGTVTGRMSSVSPNAQNFSKKDPTLRGMFLPEANHVLLTCDFDQVELRVVAALAKERKMIDAILAGVDLHQLTVDELAEAGVTITRDTAKMTNFLIVYGGGAGALAEQAGIDYGVAKRIIRAWRDRYPAINALSAKLGRLTDVVRTISGRAIPVTVNKTTGELRTYANINYLVQSSARELLVHAWYRLATEYGMGDRVWFPIHDELVLQCPEDQVAETVEAVQQCMRFDFMGVPISATAVVLRDEHGTSRWMTSKLAEKHAADRMAGLHPMSTTQVEAGREPGNVACGSPPRPQSPAPGEGPALFDPATVAVDHTGVHGMTPDEFLAATVAMARGAGA